MINLDQLIAAHGPALLLYARNWVDATSAEDVLQDALVKVWRRTGTQVADPLAYAYRCVRNAAIDRVRSDIRRRQREDRVQQLSPAFTPHDNGSADREAILTALDRLDPDRREVVILRMWAGLTFPAIAHTLTVNVNTVTSRYHAALADLRRFLLKEGAS